MRLRSPSRRASRPAPLALLSLLAACGVEPAAPAGAVDAGAADASAGACPRIGCADLDLGGAPTSTRYDPAARSLTLVLGPGAPDLASGSVSFMSAPAATAPSVHSAPLVVRGREASADLSTWIDASTVYLGALSVTLVSGCGATSVVGNLDLGTRAGASGLEVSGFVCR